MAHQRTTVGVAAAALLALGAAAAIASPGQTQYDNPVRTEKAPAAIVVSQSSTPETTTSTISTTTGTTTEATTTGATTTEPETTTAGSTFKPPHDAGKGEGQAPGQTQSSSGSELPFTGLELGLVVAFGVAAAGAGLVLRRATRKRA